MVFDMMRVTNWTAGNSRMTQVTGQRLEGFETHRICENCLQAKLASIRSPMSQFPEKFKVTIFALLAGLGLIVSGWGTRNNGFVVGIVLVGFFVLKFIRFVSAGNRKKESFRKYSDNNARFVAAWECFCEVAPRKDDRGQSIFFIPATKATYQMKASDFTAYYKLTEENANRFFHLLQERKGQSA